MPSPILARADALMQRRRSNAEVDDVPVLTDAVNVADSDDDIPVLLDIEAMAPLLLANEAPAPDITPDDATAGLGSKDTPLAEPDLIAAEAPATEQTPPVAPPLAHADIAREIARRVELRLAAELPNIIAATVRDYLAEQGEHSGERGGN